jgi:hypothetical protein
VLEAFLPLVGIGSLGGIVLAARRAPSVVAARSKPVVWAVAGLAAVGGALAPPAPTGIGPFDLVLRAGFAVVCAVAGSRARRWAWMVASAVAALGAPNEPWAVLAFAALGVTVGSLLGGGRARGRVLGALVGGAVAQVLLRLSISHRLGVTAGLGVVAMAVLAGSGIGQTRRRWRRRLEAVAAGVGVLGALAVAGAVAAALEARPSAELGVAEAQAGVAAAEQGNAPVAVDDLARAQGDLARASSELDAWWAQPGRLVPVLSQNEHALQVLSSEGERVASSAVDLATAARAATVGSSVGSVPISQLAGLARPIGASLALARRASSALGGIGSPWLVGPVSSRLDELSAKVSSLAAAERELELASRVGPSLLGSDGPTRYLLMVQDPVELRGGGGVIGDEGVIVADHGRLSLQSIETTPVPSRAELQVPQAAAAWGAEEGFDLARYPQDDSFSPDFPTDARLAEQSATQLGLPPVDGVISVDPAGLAALLQLTGPVQVPSWPVPLTADNAVPILLHEQYLAFRGEARLDFLTGAAEAVFHRLSQASLPPPTTLARVLSAAVSGKHLLLFSNSAQRERLLRALGVSGAMAPVRGDFLEVAVQDAAADKIDWYLRRSTTDQVRYDPSTGEVQSTLTLRFANLAPSSGRPSYVIGAGGTSHLLVTVYTPLHFVSGLDGSRTLLVGSARVMGRFAYSASIEVPPGGSETLVLHLADYLGSGARYHLRLAEQPAVAPDGVSLTVEPTSGWRATTTSGATLSASRAHFAGGLVDGHSLSVGFSS